MDKAITLQLEIERLKLLLREALLVLPQAREQPDDLGDDELERWMKDFEKRVKAALLNG